MTRAESQKLMDVIGGAEKQSLFVGGCVRNQLLNKQVDDIDIATQFKPEAIIKKLEAAGVKGVPTGIDHGTVTAVVAGKPYEITTLREDVATDGRHAEVKFTDDWVKDAARRDFKMNTLLADIEGNIYDPIGQGLADLKAQRVVFVGDPTARIAEDYLRILRFFRFHAFYGQGEMDAAALKACADTAEHISTLSRERVTSELLKILSVGHAAGILKIMFDHNVLREISDSKYQDAVLQKLCDLQRDHDAQDVVARLFVIGGNKPKFYDDVLRLTHSQKNFLVKLDMAYDTALYADDKALKKAIFYHGNDLLLQGYLLLAANGQVKVDRTLIDILKNWQAPACPITGEDLLAEGYQTGPELGQELVRRQEEWLKENLV